MSNSVLSANRAELELRVGSHDASELGVLSFDAREELSQPFLVQVTFAAAPELQTEKLEGERAFLSATPSEGVTRHFNGVVDSVDRLGPSLHPEKWRYRVAIRPRLWQLSRRRRSRVFQDMAAADIVVSVLREAGITHRLALSGRAEIREYCVQYCESDLDFVSRLLEEEGIFYFFEHQDDEHTLVLGDSTAAHPNVAGESQILYREERGLAGSQEVFTAFGSRRQIRPGAVVLRDVDYLRPDLDLTARAGNSDPGLEVYEHHGRYSAPQRGSDLARIRLQEMRVNAAVWSGRGTSRRLAPGYTFELSEHPDEKFNREYVILSVRHRGDQPEALSGAMAGGSSGYQNRVVCLSKDVPFRPERRTLRPTIAGWQPAVVVGPQGEEIHTDALGRVKVQFHWDREGKQDDRSSCWIRVGQALAGPGFGALYLPRIGQEVVVSFEEGDPDRPLVFGAAYNGVNTPPLDLPAEKTKSTFKSQSSPQSGGLGFNELRFEDAAGAEEVYLRAQKDLNIEVRNDKTQTVGGNETLSVEKDRSRTVGGNQSLVVRKNDDTEVMGSQLLEVAHQRTTTVGGNHTETVGGDQWVTVGGSQAVTVAHGSVEAVGMAKALTVGGAYEVTVGAAMNEIVGGAKTEEVRGAKVERVAKKKTETVGGSSSLQVGGNLEQSVKKKRSLNVEKSFTVSVGADLVQSVKEGYSLSAKKIEVAAEEEYTLKVGSASLSFKKDGTVRIKGKKVEVNGSDLVVLKASKISEN